MKKFTAFLGAVSFVLATTASAASLTHYSVKGNLLSYTIIAPNGTTQLQGLDAAQPKTFGEAHLTLDPSGTSLFSVILNPEYHVVSLGGDGSLGYDTYAGLTQNGSSNTLNGLVFNPVTHHLTGTGKAQTMLGVGSWCTSVQVATCNLLYSEHNMPVTSGSNVVYDLLFSPTLDTFSGTLVFNSKLSNGGWIQRTYSVSSNEVPVPMSGVMFGSALLGLAAARRRRGA